MALVQAGQGVLNGDAAIYAWQGEVGDWHARPVHLGWIGLANVLGALQLPVRAALDVCHVLIAALAVGGLARRSWLSALLAACLLLPLASWAEVDVPWAVAWLGAASLSGPVAALCLALSVSLSPTALLAVPALLALRPGQRWGLCLATGLTLLALTAVSGGLWWTGGRGVLTTAGHAGPAGLLALLDPVLLTALALGAHRLRWTWLWLLLPMLAPADVPGWLPLGLLAAREAVEPASRTWLALLGAWSLASWAGQGAEVRATERRIATLAQDPDPVLPESWSEQVRLSIAVTGEPYGLH